MSAVAKEELKEWLVSQMTTSCDDFGSANQQVAIHRVGVMDIIGQSGCSVEMKNEVQTTVECAVMDSVGPIVDGLIQKYGGGDPNFPARLLALLRGQTTLQRDGASEMETYQQISAEITQRCSGSILSRQMTSHDRITLKNCIPGSTYRISNETQARMKCIIGNLEGVLGLLVSPSTGGNPRPEWALVPPEPPPPDPEQTWWEQQTVTQRSVLLVAAGLMLGLLFPVEAVFKRKPQQI